MKYSIITVCYNAISNIEATIQSVVGQDYEDIEYIIVDGESTDGTLSVIKEYSQKYSYIKYTSAKDNGLYDAMNKGVFLASGDYIEFLNAGDTFYDNTVLSKMSKHIMKNSNNAKAIYYGNITYVNADGSVMVRNYGTFCGKAIYYATGDCVNHQAIFAPRESFLTSKKPFDNDTYRICADRDYMMRAHKSGYKWMATNEMIVRYSLSEDSISVRDKEALRYEERICMKRNYPSLYPIYLVFDCCRNNKVLAKALHGIYELLFIRK